MEAWLSQMGQEPSLSAAFSFGSEVKAYACNVGDLGSIPGSGRSPGEGSGTPLQYSCLENPMEGGAWGATVHGVAKSRLPLTRARGGHADGRPLLESPLSDLKVKGAPGLKSSLFS